VRQVEAGADADLQNATLDEAADPDPCAQRDPLRDGSVITGSIAVVKRSDSVTFRAAYGRSLRLGGCFSGCASSEHPDAGADGDGCNDSLQQLDPRDGGRRRKIRKGPSQFGSGQSQAALRRSSA
jgi:hypothetical protein